MQLGRIFKAVGRRGLHHSPYSSHLSESYCHSGIGGFRSGNSFHMRTFMHLCLQNVRQRQFSIFEHATLQCVSERQLKSARQHTCREHVRQKKVVQKNYHWIKKCSKSGLPTVQIRSHKLYACWGLKILASSSSNLKHCRIPHKASSN